MLPSILMIYIDLNIPYSDGLSENFGQHKASYSFAQLPREGRPSSSAHTTRGKQTLARYT